MAEPEPPSLSPRKQKPRKVTFPAMAEEERYMASTANVSLRKRGSFTPSRLANLEDAKIHRKATRVAKIPKANTSDFDRCKCCQYPINTSDFPLTCNLEELGQLGSAFPLYYYFFKYLMLILALATVIAAVPCVIANARAGEADTWRKDGEADISDYVKLSLGAYGDPYDHVDPSKEAYIPMWQALLHLVVIVLVLASYPFFRYFLHRKATEIDLMTCDSSLYTIRMTGLGKDWDKEAVTRFVETSGRWDGKPAKVVSLTPIFHISEYLALCEELTKWETKLEFVQQYVQRNSRRPRERFLLCLRSISYSGLMESEEQCEKMVHAARKNLTSFEAVSSIGESTGTAFITFRSPLDARMVARKFNSTLLEYIWIRIRVAMGGKSRRQFQGKVISANMAPQPADIFWENLDVSKCRHLKLKAETAFLAIVVLALAFGALLGMSYWKIYLSDKAKETGQDSLALHLAPFLPSVFIMAVNVAMERILRQLASYEQHYSWTTYCKSVSEKLILAEALTTSFLPFLVNLPTRDKWFMSGGLIDDIFLQIITMSILSPVLYLFNFGIVIKAYRRWKLGKTVPAGKSSLSQLACNRTFENTEVDVSSLYVRLLNQLILAFVYFPAIPLGVPITLVGFLVEYLVDKYMLLRVHCRPKSQNSMLAEHLSRIIPITMGLYAVGAVVFYTVLKAEHTYGCLIAMLVFAFCFFLIPVSTIFEWVMQAHSTDVMVEMLAGLKPEQYMYEKKASTLYTVPFTQDYKRENPVTADKGFKEWLSLIIKGSDNEEHRAIADQLLQNSPDLTLQEKMMDYNARHQNLPEMDAFLRQANSDVKDSLLDPAKYTADRMERLRSALSAGQAIHTVSQPVDEQPEIPEDLDGNIDEAPAQEHPDSATRLTSDMYQNLQFYQSPYANRSRGVLSPTTRNRVNSPLLRRMTTIMDVATPGGGEEDGELPEVPVSQVQNRRELKVPYEPEPQDPYTFPETDHQFP